MTQSGSSSVTVVHAKDPGEVLPDKTLTHRITSKMNGVRPTTTTTTTTSISTTTTSKDSSSGHVADTKQQRLRSTQRAIFVAMFLGYACYTYNRKSVSYATPTLLATGLITTSTVGVISSCQNMAYAVSKFLGGVLSDKMSARILFSIGLALSGASTLLFSRTEDPTLWAALWAVNGFAQGCGWPSCAKLLKKWFSPAHFGTLWSILTASSNVSGTLSPLLAAYVIMSHGWSASLIIAGLVSLVMAGVTLVTLIDDPCQADLPNPAQPLHTERAKETVEKKAVNTHQTPEGQAGRQGEVGGVRELVKSPFLWLVSACYLVVFMAKTAISDWGQFYLINELGRSQMEASSFTSAIETGGFFGGILAGVVTDRIASKVNVRANVRLLVAAAFMCMCCGSLYVLQAVLTPASSQVMVSGVGVVLGASMFGPISIYGIVASESFPSHLSGTAHAIVALAANVGAVMAGWPLSRVARAWSWSGVLVLLQGLAGLSALLIVVTPSLHVSRKVKTQ